MIGGKTRTEWTAQARKSVEIAEQDPIFSFDKPFRLGNLGKQIWFRSKHPAPKTLSDADLLKIVFGRSDDFRAT